MPLPLDIVGQGVPLTEALRDHVTRRLTFALGRFEERLERVQIRLEDINGTQTQCRVHVALRGMPSIHATQTAEVAYAAVDGAADKAGRTVARQLDRRLTPPRGESAIRHGS
jgi:putative sigma-54 modulation protein